MLSMDQNKSLSAIYTIKFFFLLNTVGLIEKPFLCSPMYEIKPTKCKGKMTLSVKVHVSFSFPPKTYFFDTPKTLLLYNDGPYSAFKSIGTPFNPNKSLKCNTRNASK